MKHFLFVEKCQLWVCVCLWNWSDISSMPDSARRGQQNLTALIQLRQLSSSLEIIIILKKIRQSRLTHFSCWMKFCFSNTHLEIENRWLSDTNTTRVSMYSPPVGCVWCAASEGCRHRHCPAGDVGSKWAAEAVGPECWLAPGPAGRCCPRTETSGSALQPIPAKEEAEEKGTCERGGVGEMWQRSTDPPA